MTRIILFSAVGVFLAACSAAPYQTPMARARLACADVGVGPGDAALAQCAANLDASLWVVNQVEH